MLRNYVTVIFRHIKAHKGYSFVSLASLAIGLSCSILIFLYVAYELSYDAYHGGAAQIFRVLREYKDGAAWINSSEHPLAASLKKDFPEVIKASRVKKIDEVGIVGFGPKRFYEERIYFVDQDFLDMFTFPLLSGEQASALKEPFSVLLTQDMAEKYFGRKEALGEVLRIKEWYSDQMFDYKVSGVLKNVPKNSHFAFDFLISYNTMYSLKRGGKNSVETWGYFEPKTYVKLAPGGDPESLEQKFPEFLKIHKGEDSESEKMHLQPLKSIHLGGNMRYELERNSDRRLVAIFSAIAAFILIIACLNYVNLSVARSAKRAVEVGVRKVVGAERSQLIRQFLGEAMITSILALLISLLAVSLALPAFRGLTERDLGLDLARNPALLLILLGLTLFAGLLSGSYPALLASSFQPIHIIKGTLKVGSKGSAAFRNSLVIIQFVVSIALLVSTFVVHNQLRFIRTRDLGFDQARIVTIYTMDAGLKRNPEPLKRDLLQNPDIQGVSASLDLPTTIRRSSTVEWAGQEGSKKASMNFTFVDDDFFDVYGVGMKTGRNFSSEFPSDKTQGVILNGAAARELGWDDPLGKRLSVQGRDWTVIGVTNDFNYQSLHWKIDPLVFVYFEGRGMDYLSIKIRPENVSRTLAFIEEKWKAFSPAFPFQGSFLDERIDRIYRSEQRLEKSFGVFTFLSLAIACLGLFGLVSFMLEQKRKEIGIRKVLGADSRTIVFLLAKEYMKCLALAAVAAWPIGYFIMRNWLQNFAYRTRMGVGIFILSGLVALILTLLTVGYQSVKSAAASPADSIRYE